ncbi:xanthine dehydrogenase accessory protein XdhC [Jannaschia sp. 2305UL9-9]|uniref:xanthine dehydrogenase accessory protein XdhC n=1 Tax=Jannaschia sp. 2305UL9-9 TaxID=3121638 RepID=UPI003527DC6A
MSIDTARLQAGLARHGVLARVVVAEARGSVPRAAGTEMLVWEDGFSGTIGGGALEWHALSLARSVLQDGRTRVERMALGPALGQCCGGAVTLVVERIPEMPVLPWLRRVEGTAPAPTGRDAADLLRDGWMLEGSAGSTRPIWVWGAGHVGQAICAILAPIPDMSVTCIDEPDRMPDLPPGVAPLAAADMPRAMAHAPPAAEHLILTYSHDIDLALCHAALTHGFRTCGVIGSATKWARFRTRLVALGHARDQMDRIACPIGDPTLGKHPQAIAVGVAARLLSQQPSDTTVEGTFR